MPKLAHKVEFSWLTLYQRREWSLNFIESWDVHIICILADDIVKLCFGRHGFWKSFCSIVKCRSEAMSSQIGSWPRQLIDCICQSLFHPTHREFFLPSNNYIKCNYQCKNNNNIRPHLLFIYNSIKYSFCGNFPMGNILYAKEYEHSMPRTLRGQNWPRGGEGLYDPGIRLGA